jgi:hypothetical protein
MCWATRETRAEQVVMRIPELGSGTTFANFARIAVPTPDLRSVEVVLSGANAEIQLGSVRVSLNQMPVLTLTTVYALPKGVRVVIRLSESLNPDLKLTASGENLITFEATDDQRTRYRGQFSILVGSSAAGDTKAPITTTTAPSIAPTAENADDVDSPPSPVAMPNRVSSFAVVIGISNYREQPTVPKLPYARHDAEIMAKYLETVAGVPKTNIRMIADDRATLSDIVDTVERWLPQRATENSSIFLYYAGHGSIDPATGETYLVPYEGHPDSPSTRMYAVSKLYNALEKLRSHEVTVFLDACFSGGGRSIAMKGRPIVIEAPKATLSTAKISVLAAAQGNQVSSDLDKAHHGLFTYFLLKGMGGAADSSRDGWVELGELYEFVNKNVSSTALSELDREQTPVLLGRPETDRQINTLKLFRFK